MRIQYGSDFHFEDFPKRTYEEMLLPKAPILALLGDICRLDSHRLHSFFEWCSERWETVLWIPGRLEVYESGYKTPEDAVPVMRGLISAYRNCHVLYCEAFASTDGCVVLGCSLWCRPPEPKTMLHWGGNIYAEADPCPADMLRAYTNCFKWLQTTIKQYRAPIVVLSYYSALPWHSQEEWIVDKNALPRYFDNEKLLKPPVVAWIFARCHIPVLHETYVSALADGSEQSVLFTSNPLALQRDAVLRIDPLLYLRS